MDIHAALPRLFGPLEATFARAPTRFTGRKKDRLGRTRCYEGGKQVKCHKSEAPQVAKARERAAGGLQKLAAKPGKASPTQVATARKALEALTADERRSVARAQGLADASPERLVSEANRVLTERQTWERRARQASTSPAEMVDRARQSRAVEREVLRQKADLLREARSAYQKKNGKPLTRGLKAGGDYTMLPGWDLIARDLAARYPELLGAHGYDDNSASEQEAYQRLFDLVAEGPPKLRPWADHYQAALDGLVERGPTPKRLRRQQVAPDDEDALFAAEDGPFTTALEDALADLVAEGGAACCCEECEDASFAWDESLHPRDRGRFAEKPAPGMARTPSPGVPTLPALDATHPALAAFGAALHHDGSPTARHHLAYLASVPPALAAHLAERFAARGPGAGIHLGEGGVPALDDLGHLAGQRPEAWDGVRNTEGTPTTWDDVPGAYDASRAVAVAGTGNSTLPVPHLALHELGHAVGDLLGWERDGELQEAHREAWASMRPYYRQGGPGSKAGCAEALAEGFALLLAHGEPRCSAAFGPRLTRWLQSRLAPYHRGERPGQEAPTATPAVDAMMARLMARRKA